MSSVPFGSDEFLDALDQAARSSADPILIKFEPQDIRVVAHALRDIIGADEDTLPPGMRERAEVLLRGIGMAAGTLTRGPHT